ncbi:MAG: hypothetical protein IT532_05930 [Burkholderiales bacterium]|nr:hypothetical protein [Burkholderiales bacterium]
MRTRVPARAGEIESADEGDALVHHDDLLMLRAAQRMVAVEGDVQAAVAAPAVGIWRRQLAHGRVQHREVPVQDAHVQCRIAYQRCVQQFAEGDRPAVVRILGQQKRAAVDVPGDD